MCPALRGYPFLQFLVEAYRSLRGEPSACVRSGCGDVGLPRAQPGHGACGPVAMTSRVIWAGASSTPHASRRRRTVLAAVPRQFKLLDKETIAAGDYRLPAHRPICDMFSRQRVQPKL